MCPREQDPLWQPRWHQFPSALAASASCGTSFGLLWQPQNGGWQSRQLTELINRDHNENKPDPPPPSHCLLDEDVVENLTNKTRPLDLSFPNPMQMWTIFFVQKDAFHLKRSFKVHLARNETNKFCLDPNLSASRCLENSFSFESFFRVRYQVPKYQDSELKISLFLFLGAHWCLVGQCFQH